MPKKTRTRKVMTEENFKTIKRLEDRLEQKEIAKLSGYSVTTIWRVRESEDFEHFTRVQREKRLLSEAKRRQSKKTWEQLSEQQELPVEEPQASGEIPVVSYMEHQATRIADSLERVVNILERIGDS